MASRENHGEHETIQFSKLRGLAEKVELAWQTQQDSASGIDLSALLPGPGDPLRPLSLFEIIKTDLACRWKRDMPTSLEMYIEKFPEIGPIEKIPPQLIYEEYRIRKEHGHTAPLTQYKSRFPTQFEQLESMIQTEKSSLGNVTEASHPEINVTSSNPIQSVPSAFAIVQNGTVVGGHYTLEKRIGTGGFGEVWKAMSAQGNLPKAVKIITRSIESDEAKTELSALEIITKLNHPYLLRTEGFFAEQERLIVVMELADGSLREALKKAKKETDSGLPVDKLLRYMKHAAEALDYLHEEGIFHRDIKPENILLVGRVAKVADFGLARLAANKHSTKTNFAGTSAYSSPETWKGRVTAKSDQYSLAVTYGELRLGRAVVKGTTIYEYMVEHLQNQPNLDPIPPEEQEVLLKALAKEPAERFQSCSEFVRVLEAAITSPGGLAAGGAIPRTTSSPSGPPSPMSKSKWSTPPVTGRPPSNPSVDLNTQYGGGTAVGGGTTMGGNSGTGTRPKSSWNRRAASTLHPDAEPESDEIDPQPISRRRRRNQSNPVLVILAAVVILALVGFGASLAARSSVLSRALAQAKKLEFDDAKTTIDDCNILAAPYRDSLEKEVVEQGNNLAKDYSDSGNLAELSKLTANINKVYRGVKGNNASEILATAFNAQIPAMIKNNSVENFAKAYALVNSAPKFTGQSELQENITNRWLDLAWAKIDGEDYSGAIELTSELLKLDRAQAQPVHDFAFAAKRRDWMLDDKKFDEFAKKIGYSAPKHKEAKPLWDTLRADVKKAWLDYAAVIGAEGNVEKTKRTLLEFRKAFPNERDPSFDSTATALVKKSMELKRFDEAIKTIEELDLRNSDLRNKARLGWRDYEILKFTTDDDDVKRSALQRMRLLANQFSEFDETYREYSKKYVEEAIRNTEKAMEQGKLAVARNLAKNTGPFAISDPALEVKVNVLELTALLRIQGLKKSDGEPDEIKRLLGRVMNQRSVALKEGVDLKEILDGVLAMAEADSEFRRSVRADLGRFQDYYRNEQLPPKYFEVTGISKSVGPEAVGSEKTLVAAEREYNLKDWPKSLEILRKGITPKTEPLKRVKVGYYELLAKLGEHVALNREELTDIEANLGDNPNIKSYLNAAMAKIIVNSLETWPSDIGSDTWENRRKEAETIEKDSAAKSPVVTAYKAEAMLELKLPVKFEPPPGQGETKPYVDYVRALIRADSKKREDVTLAARELQKLPEKAPWLLEPRKKHAAKILEAGAFEETKSIDGTRQIFDSADQADQVFALLNRAMQLVGIPNNDVTKLTKDFEVALALAAACKSSPDFVLSKRLGDDLLSRYGKQLGRDRVDLVLSNPIAFEKELNEFKAEKRSSSVGSGEVTAMLTVGKSQMESAKDNAALDQLTERQALLYVLKGWSLEQADRKNLRAIFDAYKQAKDLVETNPSYWILFGRAGAEWSIEASEAKGTNASAKLSFIEDGIEYARQGLKHKQTDHEDRPVLLVRRSELGVLLGNHKKDDSKVKIAQLQDIFEEASKFAEEAIGGKKLSGKEQARAYRALGNSLEDLAKFGKKDPETNFKAGVDAHDKSWELEPAFRYNAGRCRYRWAREVVMPPAEKKGLLNAALKDFKSTSANLNNPKFAEANYFEGSAYFYLDDYPAAVESFQNCIRAAEKVGAAPYPEWSIVPLAASIKIQMQKDKNYKAAVGRIEETDKLIKSHAKDLFDEDTLAPLKEPATISYLKLADSEAKANDAESFKLHIDEAMKAGYPELMPAVMVARALGSKKFAKELKIGSPELQTLRTQAQSAIESSPLPPQEKDEWRSALEKGWK